MWKGEAPEVRAKYLKKSLEIKATLLAVHPNYRYSPRKSSEIRRRAPRRPAQTPPQPGSPSHARPGSRARVRPFEHNAHLTPEENNLKAGLETNSQITRCVPGAQQFLPPVVAAGWTPYHLLPGATSPVAATPADEDIAEEDEEEEDLIEEAPAQQILADDGMNINAGPDFAAVDEFMANWDIDADLARILAEV
jgi:hypothetical protein